MLRLSLDAVWPLKHHRLGRSRIRSGQPLVPLIQARGLAMLAVSMQEHIGGGIHITLYGGAGDGMIE